jgi:hypothetical protein
VTQDVSEVFSRRVGERELARVLELVETQPNRRDRPLPEDLDGDFDYWFDGGACRVLTGWQESEFFDGTVVQLAAPVPALSLEVRFPDGRRVRIQQESLGVDEKAI